MALRGKKPETVQKRLKAFFYGQAGVGKTTTAIQFPSPYLIDTERGAENDQYTRLLKEAGGAYFFTADFDEAFTEVMTLLSEKHGYKTLIIDPITVIYSELMDRSARSLATKEDPEGMAFGRHKAKADRQIKRLINMLFRLDMNVILTAHSKKVWGPGMTDLGQTFDAYAKLDYVFDLVFEVQKRGDERIGIVKKTRHEKFLDGKAIPFDYASIADLYGRDILERKAVAEVLATPEQVAEIVRLVDLLKIPESDTDKWLDKAMASTWAEMPAATAQKTIDWLMKKITAPEPVKVGTAREEWVQDAHGRDIPKREAEKIAKVVAS